MSVIVVIIVIISFREASLENRCNSRESLNRNLTTIKERFTGIVVNSLCTQECRRTGWRANEVFCNRLTLNCIQICDATVGFKVVVESPYSLFVATSLSLSLAPRHHVARETKANFASQRIPGICELKCFFLRHNLSKNINTGGDTELAITKIRVQAEIVGLHECRPATMIVPKFLNNTFTCAVSLDKFTEGVTSFGEIRK